MATAKKSIRQQLREMTAELDVMSKELKEDLIKNEAADRQQSQEFDAIMQRIHTADATRELQDLKKTGFKPS